MTPSQELVLSSFLNTVAGLPADVQEIAEMLKDKLTPVVEEVISAVEATPAEAAVAEEATPVEEAAVSEQTNG